jgi:hypothetical protein
MTTNVIGLRNSKSGTFIERFAWIPLLIVILLLSLNGLSDMIAGGAEFQTGETVFIHSITGISWNELQASSPGVANLVDVLLRMAGAAEIIMALLSAAVCLTGFRRGERWAWFMLWVIPLWFGVTDLFILTVEKVPGSGMAVPVIPSFIFVIICVISLGLSCRKFFRSQQRSNNGGA